MSGLSPPTFATLFRQFLQRDTTSGATRVGRGALGRHVTATTALQYHPASMAGCPEAYGLPIAMFEQVSRVLLDFQLISVQSLS